MQVNKALFLDRDGVINIDFGHVYKVEDFVFVKDIEILIKDAINKNYLIIVITNQAGIGKGLYSVDDFNKISQYMNECLLEKDCFIDDIFYCPYHPSDGIGKFLKDSNDRKPKPGMLIKAQKKYDIDMTKSVLIGDKISDIEAGVAAGVKTNILYKELSENSSLVYEPSICSLKEGKDYL